MALSFQRRRLRITFQLAAATFSKEGNPDTIVLEDYRARAEIQMAGGYEFSTCKVRIYGVGKDAMDRLTVINYQNLDYYRNILRVEATDANGLFTTVFLGEIYQAFPDYTGAPDVPFIAEARTGIVGSLAPSQPTSYPGPQKVSVMMEALAKELNLAFENNGVDTVLTDQYLGGTALQKVQKLAANARIQYWYLPEQGILSIAPIGFARNSNPITYNIDSGLVGWPTRLHNGVAFTALFVPQVFQGSVINMESSVPACNGEWYIVSMTHRLDCLAPGGAWFTDFNAAPVGAIPFVR